MNFTTFIVMLCIALSAGTPTHVDPRDVDAIAFPASRIALHTNASVPGDVHVICEWDEAQLCNATAMAAVTLAEETRMRCYANVRAVDVAHPLVRCKHDPSADPRVVIEETLEVNSCSITIDLVPSADALWALPNTHHERYGALVNRFRGQRVPRQFAERDFFRHRTLCANYEKLQRDEAVAAEMAEMWARFENGTATTEQRIKVYAIYASIILGIVFGVPAAIFLLLCCD